MNRQSQNLRKAPATATAAGAFCTSPFIPSQALPRQLPHRGSQAVKSVAKVLSVTRKLPAAGLALPLGELSPQVTERAQNSSAFPQRDCFRRKQALQLPFSVTTLSRENTKPERPQTLRLCSIKIIFPLMMCRAQRSTFQIVRPRIAAQAAHHFAQSANIIAPAHHFCVAEPHAAGNSTRFDIRRNGMKFLKRL